MSNVTTAEVNELLANIRRKDKAEFDEIRAADEPKLKAIILNKLREYRLQIARGPKRCNGA